MSIDPFRPSLLQRATSRTRTARTPLAAEAIWLFTMPNTFTDLYAGIVDPTRFPPEDPRLSGIRGTYPITQGAVQLFACDLSRGRQDVIDRVRDPVVFLIVDLGESRDIARIELYGNLLLPPIDEATGPLHNFGLPRRIGVAVSEMPTFRTDLHRLPHIDAWLDANSSPFHLRYEAEDLRALWGWTPIHLPPTYGRFLLFCFADLPLVCQHSKDGGVGRGIDLQRLVIYPYLEDVDHHPTVEHTVVSVRQTNYPLPATSTYWNSIGETPAPATHQSVARFGDRLPWPTVLCGLPVRGTDFQWTYESDLVELDSTDRVVITITATSDETPVLDGVRFVYFPDEDNKDLPGIARDAEVLYRADIYVTNDEEAAWSSDLTHPSWRLVRAGAAFAAIRDFYSIVFAEPVRARFVRVVFGLSSRPGAMSGATHGRVRLSFIGLCRCRDFIVTPEPDEDISVDSVLLRLHGRGLADDYAYINGADGLSITVEGRTRGGPFQEIRSIRHLLDLVENTAARPFANARITDKPIQRYREHVEGIQSGSTRTDTTDSLATTDSSLPPNTRNVTVSRTGSTTEHVRNAKNELNSRGDPNLGVFPSTSTDGVSTRRIMEGNIGNLPDPLSIQNPDDVVQFIGNLLANPDTSPIPLNFGVGLSGSLGFQVGAGASVGLSLSAGGSVGGGKTLAIVRGDQASVGESQTTTLHSESHQQVRSTGYSVQARTGDSIDDRDVRREDYSEEVRKTGVAIRYGGSYEDIILVTIPIRRSLTGRAYVQTAADEPPLCGDMVRVRVDHIPRGVRLDVEFRGTISPRVED